MHTASYEFLMKPKESARCHQTLSARVGSGDETKREQAPINPLSPPSLAVRLRSERERAAYMRLVSCHRIRSARPPRGRIWVVSRARLSRTRIWGRNRETSGFADSLGRDMRCGIACVLN